ncbi:MAG: hypothetical protein GQ574_17435 [Crocinitomix sp.]|nr:hypothetical protein [Crocinitomix sp.]
MKRLAWILPLVLIVFASCKKDVPPPVEETLERYTIAPSATDNAYNSGEKRHLIFYNNETNVNKLLLFFGGTYSNPETYETFCEHAAELGCHVISLSYPNNVAAASFKESDNIDAFDNFRDEMCFGNPVSDAVNVNELNSVVTRSTKLLQHLAAQYPTQNWGQYLIDGNAPDWSKIMLGGHSQGSGHACYIAKTIVVNRVLMFSGPNDYSTHFEAPATWLSLSGVTPVASQYAFLHANDEVVPYEYQLANIRAIGVIGAADTTTLMDDLSGAYNNKNAYHTSISALTEHGSTLGGNWRLPNFWTYLLGEN